jgi:hypothetical protein
MLLLVFFGGFSLGQSLIDVPLLFLGLFELLEHFGRD